MPLLQGSGAGVQALRLRIAKLQKLAFGKSSEKIEREIEQLELALEDLLVAVAEADDAPIDEGQSLRDRSVTMTLMIDPFAPFPRQLYPDLQQLMRPNTAAVGCKVVAVSTRTDVHAA